MSRQVLVGLAAVVALLLAGATRAAADEAPNAAQVVTWATQHAPAIGLEPLPLAQALLASGFYESELQDVPNRSHSGAEGPFQFYGPTLATAQAQGFNIDTVAGSLDAFAASGDLQLGIQAYRQAQAQGADASTTLHAFYLAMERPGAGEDATRYLRGDWATAVSFAQRTSGRTLAAAPPDLPSALRQIAATADRAARASDPAQRQWPSGAIGPPGRFVGDTLVDAAGVAYSWDGSTWVLSAPAP